jgi:centromeric protein E
MATLPRPPAARPSIAPPTGPLPSLPMPKKSRVSNIGPTSRPPSSLLPSPATARAVSSSVLPHRPASKGYSHSAINIPTLTTTDAPAGPLPAGRGLRKTVSIGAFPQPPKHGGRISSHPPSPLSAISTPNSDALDEKLSAISKTSPTRRGSIKKLAPRVSNVGGRGLLAKSPLTPPSFFNGSGESASVVNTGHLSLPSPPQSRTSSAHGSYATSATTIEDIADDDRRRTDDTSTGELSPLPKDGKGNVVVSVRVRPDAGAKDSSQEADWEINNKRGLLTYNGREGGEFCYGTVTQHYA